MASVTGNDVPDAFGEGRMSDLEAHILSYIVARAPTTAYEITRVLDRSPVSALSGSTGAIYPSVRRLVDRGLVAQEPVASARRGKTLLRPTDMGRGAIERWATTVEPADLLLHDPLRVKVMQLAALDKAAQIRFLIRARQALDAKRDELDAHARENPGVYVEFAYDGARSLIDARRAWLDRILLVVADL